MKGFNLTEIALKNKSLVYYFIIVTFIMGIFSYEKLGRMEDPDFVIRQMVVSVAWPGASAREVEEQVTDKLEKKLQDIPGLDYLESKSYPGKAVIYVTLVEDFPKESIKSSWFNARNLVNDIKVDLPEGVVGPFFNDSFDDVFGSIYALTGDGYSYEEMRVEAERIRRTLLNLNNVKKVELIGEQPEKIYVEVETSKLAQLGISPDLIASVLKNQNAMNPAGMVETQTDDVYMRVTGQFDSVEAIQNLAIRANGKTFRLGDIATVERKYVEPAEPKMYFNGHPAIGIALSMSEGGNILKLGDDLSKTVDQISKDLPLGLELNQVSNQPKVVKNSIGEFVRTLLEAIAIVLLVSFLSLGVRTGLVVAGCIPLVIAGVFLAMYMLNISLHKVSLGALIIALGLLVDDAIIAVEMMAVKLEQGYERFEAACYAYTVTAVPMLTGTLITCAGFIPVGFSKGMSAEFTSSLFPVISIALIISWIVSVMVAPLFGYYLIRVKVHQEDKDPYQSKFYKFFRNLLTWCLRHRVLVIGCTIICFIGSIGLLKLVKQEFFPPSTRPEIIVSLTLPEGASMKATDMTANRFAAMLDGLDGIENYSYYAGEGSPRFVLTMTPELPATNFAQFIVVAKDNEAREKLIAKFQQSFSEEFSNVIGNIRLIQTGPPAEYPVMFRVSGYEHEKVREIADEVSNIMVTNDKVKEVKFNWKEKSKVMHLDLDQDKLRNLGIDAKTFSLSLQTQLSGAAIAEYYEGDKTVDIVFRMSSDARGDLSKIKDMPIYIGNRYVPLEQIAKVSYSAEDGKIARRDLKPAITLGANIIDGVTGNDVANEILQKIKGLQDNLPPGYTIESAGALESSDKSIEFMMVPIPAMIIVIITLLMFQLKRMSLMFITLMTAPLGIIGVATSMLITNQSMGFVAELGVLALSGMIIRNSVILIDQIEKHIADGEDPWHAIIDSAILRFRPIMLTAAAAILGMIPLMRSNFWGPMAVAIAGGLFCATVLTLLVLPTMYAAWFKVKEENE
ncbi:efflux RND transporter permease subunit [Anaerosinus gibii]|uniref:Efflux RND transporter permease subunit n=1 Tax=Selenobaculum gibii TaxID=3054208 RepID=A0A9Y2AFC4_9FIRM|nr:efflux RND transporter permease subunit [Selenobaculum gbiensis]WIW70585.1 efflux RND transporter permease subunit [Selenobaculum gbiensis]